MTTLAPLMDAAPVVQIHAVSALLALVLGPVALFRRRRDRGHRVVGYTWIAAMAVTALSSFWINGMALIGPFGPIHLLSVLTLVTLTLGLRAARQRRIAAHRQMMQALYLWALGVAGLFTLLPGRVMHRVVFGADSPLGFAVLALAVLGALALWRGRGRQTNAR